MAASPDLMLQAAQGQVTAAWVQAWAGIWQALLSVAAIVAAAWIARGDRMHESALRAAEAKRVDDRMREDAKKRARTAALGIIPSLNNASGSISWAVEKLAAGAPANEIGNDGPRPEDGIPLWRTVAMPSDLKDKQPTLSELGSAAAPVQIAYFGLLSLQLQFDYFVESHEHDGPEHTWRYADGEVADIRKELEECEASIKIATKAIADLFTGIALEH